jgi:hypothetical protein
MSIYTDLTEIRGDEVTSRGGEVRSRGGEVRSCRKFYDMKAIWRAATAEHPPAYDHSDNAQHDLEDIGFVCVKHARELAREFESELRAARRRSPEQRGGEA